jgi:hypothetical protein
VATLTLIPMHSNGRRTDQYVIDLLFGDYVILSELRAREWQATIHPLHRPPVDRGVFASPQRALRLFEHEVTTREVDNAGAQLRFAPYIG